MFLVFDLIILCRKNVLFIHLHMSNRNGRVFLIIIIIGQTRIRVSCAHFTSSIVLIWEPFLFSPCKWTRELNWAQAGIWVDCHLVCLSYSCFLQWVWLEQILLQYFILSETFVANLFLFSINTTSSLQADI